MSYQGNNLQEVALTRKIQETFIMSELNRFTRSFGVDIENLEGNEIESKIHSLVEYAKRRGRFDELISQLIQARPNARWPRKSAVPDSNLERVSFILRGVPPICIQNAKEDMENFFSSVWKSKPKEIILAPESAHQNSEEIEPEIIVYLEGDCSDVVGLLKEAVKYEISQAFGVRMTNISISISQ